MLTSFAPFAYTPPSMHLHIASSCPKCSGRGTVRVVNPSWLRARRMRKGMSLRALARKIGLSPAFLCDVEYGRRTCSPDLLLHYREL